MQPYFFPYIGYFQLIRSVDKFVFYDDVNFINRGWVNRNRILVNGGASYFTVPLKGASQNKLIKDIDKFGQADKLRKSLEFAYRKAPFFSEIFTIVDSCLGGNFVKISELAIYSVTSICRYLGLEKDFEVSSEKYSEFAGMGKAERLIKICQANGAETYHNAIGGQALYSKEVFADARIELKFLKSLPVEYVQLNVPAFVPWLSIIDVLMFNSRGEALKLLDRFELL